MSAQRIQLRTIRSVAEVAQELAHVLWKDLESDPKIVGLDSHRFPALVQALDQCLWAHVNMCEIWPEGASRSAADALQGQVCKSHEQRLLAEAGVELRKLLRELEFTMNQFFSGNSKTLESSFKKKIHSTIQHIVAPCVYKNVASPCCNECLRLAANA